MCADLFKFVQAGATSLAGAGATTGDTSVILTSLADPDGNLLAMTDFGSIGFGTIEPNSSTNEEQISFSGITQNSNGTATLTGVKTVLFKAPYTQTSGLAKTHAGGTTFVISNTAGFYDTMTSKSNDETITGIYTFAQFPVGPSSAPTTDYQMANKKYADDLAIAGSPNMDLTTKGIAEQATVGEIDAGTQSGATGAHLAVNPLELSTSIYATRLPTADEKAALDGSGTPSVSNKFVTADTDALKELLTNKDTTTTLGTSNTLYPTQNAVKTYVDTNIPLVTWKVGSMQYETSTASGTTVIAHGLGRIPRLVILNGTLGKNNTSMQFSYGAYDGTNQSCIYGGDGSSSYNNGASTSYTIRFSYDNGNFTSGVVTVDATNITITWTKTGSPSGNSSIQWSVQ